MARRDDRGYREYLREEQRRQPGCPAREVVRDQRGLAISAESNASPMPAELVSIILPTYNRRALLQDLVAKPFHADGYGFQVELVMRAWLRGWTIGEVPITFREREHGHSKLSRRIVFEALWLVTRWGVALRALGRPYPGPSVQRFPPDP